MRRARLGKVVAGLAVVALSSTASSAYLQDLRPPPEGWHRFDTGRSHYETPVLGVQYNGTWSHYTDEQRAQVLDTLAGAKAKWVRIDVSWKMLQPNGDQFDWTWGVPFVDKVLKTAHDHGLKVMLTLYQTPEWESGTSNLNVPPRDPEQFAAIAGWAADRWRNIVDAWEIWNEPNADDFFAGTDPAQYVQLLCATYRQVHKQDPQSPVVFGGVKYNDDEWIRRAYAAGAHGCFDIMATHPYQGDSAAPPETRDDGNVWWLSHTEAVRRVMVANGDADKPIWFTEFGWSTKSPANPEPWDTGVSDAEQADYLARSVTYTRARFPYVTAMFWFRDTELATGDAHEDGYGLLTTSLEPKPSLFTFRQEAER